MCFSVRPARRDYLPVRIFLSSILLCCKSKKPVWMLNLRVIFSCSLMDLGADCQRKWIVSLLSVPAFTPSCCLCLLPPISLSQPFLHSYLSVHCLCLSPSFHSLCLHSALIPPSVTFSCSFFVCPHSLLPGSVLTLLSCPLSSRAGGTICSALFWNLTGCRLLLRR